MLLVASPELPSTPRSDRHTQVEIQKQIAELRELHEKKQAEAAELKVGSQ